MVIEFTHNFDLLIYSFYGSWNSHHENKGLVCISNYFGLHQQLFVLLRTFVFRQLFYFDTGYIFYIRNQAGYSSAGKRGIARACKGLAINRSDFDSAKSIFSSFDGTLQSNP